MNIVPNFGLFVPYTRKREGYELESTVYTVVTLVPWRLKRNRMTGVFSVAIEKEENR